MSQQLTISERLGYVFAPQHQGDYWVLAGGSLTCLVLALITALPVWARVACAVLSPALLLAMAYAWVKRFNELPETITQAKAEVIRSWLREHEDSPDFTSLSSSATAAIAGGALAMDAFISAHDVPVFESPINIDGTPMVAGTGVDIHGNPFGVSSPSLDAYSSPFGSSDIGSSSLGSGAFDSSSSSWSSSSNSFGGL